MLPRRLTVFVAGLAAFSMASMSAGARADDPPTGTAPSAPTPPPGVPPGGPPGPGAEGWYGAPPPYGPPPGWGRPEQQRPMAELPATLEYGEGELVPPGYHVETRSNIALIVTGISLFGTGYLIGVSMSGIDEQLNPLAIPIAGPFMAISTTNSEGGGTFALLCMGVSQGLGVAMTVVGFAIQSPLLVRDAAPSARLVVAPTDGGAAGGIAGQF